jgi:transcription initiation factor TFIIE subunit alpha
LAASSAASTHDTPSGLGASGSDDSGDFPDNDDEDRKPSIQYLDSLNSYRKRSRSKEDERLSKKKVAKISETNGHIFSFNGGGLEEEVGAVGVEVTPEDDPFVHGRSCSLPSLLSGKLTGRLSLSVKGTPIPFSKITEEDQDLMTPEEYTTYFEVIQTRG